MTPAQRDQLDVLASDLYVLTPAARLLLEESIHGTDPETRVRASAALTALDPLNPVSEAQARAMARADRGAEHYLRAVPRRVEPSHGAEADEWEASRSKGDALAFRPMTVAQLYSSTSDAIEWLLHGLLPAGAVVLLVAYMKAGKTTLVYALIAALLRGDLFLDRQARACRVLLWGLEEHQRDMKRRLLRFGVPEDAPLFVHCRPVSTAPSEWAELVAFVRAQRIDLIVVDALVRCWPAWGVDDENDNTRMTAALQPLVDLCHEAGVTALLLHHTSKLSEGNGREIRGAGAILAQADLALILDRYRAGDPCDRIIRTLGRYDEVPPELVIRYERGASTYAVVRQEEGDDVARGAERLFPQVLSYLRRLTTTGASMRDVRKNVHGRGTIVDRAVELLLERDGIVLRDGRYYHADYDPKREGTR